MPPAFERVPSAVGRRVLIHPGMVKTATTTLQRHVFARMPGIDYLGLPAPTPALEWAIRHICQADSIHVEPDRVRDIFDAHLAAAPASGAVLISHENIALYKSKDKGLIAERLHHLFPEAKIVFTIRRQEDLIISRYFNDLRKSLKDGRFLSFKTWYWLAAHEPYRSIHDDIRFGALIDYYAGLFGRDNVHILLFEELKESQARFAGRFAQLLGVDAERFLELMEGNHENASLSRRAFWLWRLFGGLVPRRVARQLAVRRPLRPGPAPRIDLPDDVGAHLAQLCAADNMRLMRTYGVNLARYGYTLSPPSPREQDEGQSVAASAVAGAYR